MGSPSRTRGRPRPGAVRGRPGPGAVQEPGARAVQDPGPSEAVQDPGPSKAVRKPGRSKNSRPSKYPGQAVQGPTRALRVPGAGRPGQIRVVQGPGKPSGATSGCPVQAVPSRGRRSNYDSWLPNRVTAAVPSTASLDGLPILSTALRTCVDGPGTARPSISVPIDGRQAPEGVIAAVT